MTSGELSPLAMGRFDLAKYNNGAKTLSNVLINQLGGAFYRPGTRFVIETKDSSKLSRLLPFQYSTQQYYVIEAGDEYMKFFTSSALLTLDTSGNTIDLMEYSTDALAQTAYATNDTTATADQCSGGAAISGGDHASYPKKNAFDDNASTTWVSSQKSPSIKGTSYIGYDFGSGVTKAIGKFTIKQTNSSNGRLTSVKLEYSDNGSSWTTQQTFTIADDSNVNPYYTSVAPSAHRYWRLLANGDVNGGAGNTWDVLEVEFMERSYTLQAYSESTVFNQGTYSLKCVATQTTSLNKTLTKTIASPLDLSNKLTLKFDIYAQRTGANIKIGLHDSGGTTSEKTHTVSSANTWETVTWDISAIDNADKDAIDQIIITVVNADAVNTFYIDNFHVYVTEITSPYDYTDLADLQFAQDADTMYIVHPDYAPYKLQRTSATTFTLTAVSFVRPPLLDDNITSVTITPSAATGNGITLTASSATFLATNVGGFFKVNNAIVKITAFISTTVVKGDVQAEPDGSAGNIGGTSAYRAWAEGAFSARRGYPSAVCFHEQRLYYANTSHEPQKFWGSAIQAYDSFDPGDGTAADDAVTFEIATEQVNAIKWISSSDQKLDIGTSGGTFSASGGTEAITASNIQVSRSTTIGAADILPARMSSYLYYIQRNLNQVRELVYDDVLATQKSNDMCILADHIIRDGNGAVEMAHQQSPHDRLWVIRDDGTLAVLTRNVDQEVMGWSRITAGTTSKGAGLFESIAIIQQDSGDDQIWVIVKRTMSDGSVKRYVEYFTSESFIDTWDAIRLDSSLTLDNPKTITGATSANPVVITCTSHGFSDGDQVRIDGIVGMTELNGNEYLVAGSDANSFHLHTLAGDNVDGSAYTDYISGGEAREMFSTISGLDHLEGETVSVTADSSIPTTATYTVVNGSITLSDKAAVVHAGLPYVSDIRLLKLGDGNPMGSGQASYRRIYKVILRVDKSLGAKMGKDEDSLLDIFDATQTDFYTGDVTPSFESWWDRGDELLIRQSKPLPFNLLAALIYSEVEQS